MAERSVEHVDVLIIGAGLSGIGAAAHLTRELPRTSYVVLEAREVSGGTWDLFRYPGVRSDSDMYTMGYRFRPWRHEEALGSGERILEYLRDTAREYDVERRIRYSHRVVRASWDSETALWTVEAEHHGETVTFTAGLVWSCRGYYDYEHGHEPEFAGAAEFGGPIVHPQHWPADLDYAGKDVVVIGSGATAVTLVPGHGPDRRPRDDAAAVADVRDEPAAARPVRRARPSLAPRPSRSSSGAVEEHPGDGVLLPAVAPAARDGEAPGAQAERRAPAGGVRRRHPLHPALRPVGPADVLRSGRRPVQVGTPRRRGGGHVDHRAARRRRDRAHRRSPPARRRHRHRDRADAVALRWDRAGRRRREGRPDLVR